MDYGKQDLSEMIEALSEGKGEYEWDEIEEIITDCFDDDRISSDEFDELMEKLNGIEP
ncbi:MAG: hypothetical protein VZR00_00735 [Lachnospiraceae bacterium]|jgi:hypothetical protein|nr:hypothetical protein [Lachnospiraceae bacterium]MEE3460401.1 hypothetical protein [Lachnospiraceae bacterium]